jgi:hypothetical protein
VGFRDTCRILEGDNVFWDSLLMFVLCVKDDYSRTIVVTDYKYLFPIFLCSIVI